MSDLPYGLTPELLRTFRFIDQYIAENDYPPSYDEIAIGFGLKSKSGVSRSIQLLKDRGLIDSLPNVDRSLRILRRPGMTFLPDELRKALDDHCAVTGERPFDVLCDAVKVHLDECEIMPAEAFK